MKCKRTECKNEAADGQVYCCRQCSPWGHLVSAGAGIRKTETQKVAEKKKLLPPAAVQSQIKRMRVTAKLYAGGLATREDLLLSMDNLRQLLV